MKTRRSCRNPHWPARAAFAAAFALCAWSAHAAGDKDIHVSGANTLRVEECLNQGDKSARPYQNPHTH